MQRLMEPGAGARARQIAAAFARDHLRRAGPAALLLALATGAATVLGAHVYNAWPTAAFPYGEPGPAPLERGVAYVRPALVLTASLPALLLGLQTAQGLDGRHRWRAPLARVGADLGLLAAAAGLAAAIGAWGTASAPAGAVVALAVSTALLAWSFHALGVLAGTLGAQRANAGLFAVGTWLAFHALYESFVRWRLFRATSYYELRAGDLPLWFVAAQALSPLSAYRGLMILWRPEFRDGLEREALRNATLPGWLGAGALAVVLLLWTVIPLGVAALLWARRMGPAAPDPEPRLHAAWRGDDADWVEAWGAATTEPRR